MKKIAAILLSSVLPLISMAQTPKAAQREAMKKLDYMVGVWKGSGWVDGPEGRQNVIGTETVQSKLNGLALLIEGKFGARIPGQNEELVVHETLAVLAFDEQAKKYEFRTYLANGSQGEHELKLIDGGWQWGLPAPGGSVRFTFKLTDKGEWFEIGEFSQDGKTWRKFMEFTLSRVP